MHFITSLRRRGAPVVFAFALALSACGGSSTTTTSTAPVIASLSPTFGQANATTPVTIIGIGFQTGATVAFGASPATNVVVLSSTAITATSPALTAGTMSVVVRNPDGQATGALTYTYVPPGGNPPPTILNLSLNGVPPTGGSITIP